MPSPLTIKIQERETEFDKFGITPKSDSIGTNARTQIKSFHRATILAVLTELDRDIENERVLLHIDESRGDNIGVEERWGNGHNSALAHVRAKLSEAIKELGE